jgi:hypothetical protein
MTAKQGASSGTEPVRAQQHGCDRVLVASVLHEQRKEVKASERKPAEQALRCEQLPGPVSADGARDRPPVLS